MNGMLSEPPRDTHAATEATRRLTSHGINVSPLGRHVRHSPPCVVPLRLYVLRRGVRVRTGDIILLTLPTAPLHLRSRARSLRSRRKTDRDVKEKGCEPKGEVSVNGREGGACRTHSRSFTTYLLPSSA